MAKSQPNDRNTNAGVNVSTQQEAEVDGARTAGEPDEPRPSHPPAMGAPGGEGTAQPGEVVSPHAGKRQDTGFHDYGTEALEDRARRQREDVAAGRAPAVMVMPGAAGLVAHSGHEPQAEREGAADDFEILPESGGRDDERSKDLLYRVCEIYGVNPGAFVRPRELASWRYYEANRLEGTPAAVTIVTAGGVKLKEYADPSYPRDPETDERLRGIFKSYTFNEAKQKVELPLPDNKTLPAEQVDGQVRSQAHVRRAGWRRAGRAMSPADAAKMEADRNAESARRGER